MILAPVVQKKNISNVMANWTNETTPPMVAVVVGIIKVNQTLLICQRPPGKAYSGYWEFPGGKIEPNELPYDALVRELKEELGITVLAATPLWEHQHTYPDKKVLLKLWQITAFEGEPEGKEGQALCFASPQALSTKNLLEGNRIILDKIKEIYNLRD